MSRLFTASISLFLFLSITGCASVHPGKYAMPVDENGGVKDDKETGLGLIISGREVEYYSSRYFGFIDLTFENKSENWIRIKRVKVDFGKEEANSYVKFTSGRDIIHWSDAVSKRNAIREQNERVVLGSIAALGYGLALSNNEKLNVLGTVTGLGALTSLSINEYYKNLDKLQTAKIFPESHLLADEFIIPPGLFVKKWILFNTSNHKKLGYVKGFNMEYETDSGRVEKVRLIFRSLNMNSNNNLSPWQDDHQY